MGNVEEFLRATRAGDMEKVRALLENIDVNVCNINGLTALHLASKNGDFDMVAELISRGANVNNSTKNGNTPLHVTCLAGNEAIVEYLIQYRSDVNARNGNSITPLYMAAQGGFTGAVRYLLDNGADQRLSTTDGYTPYNVAVQQGHGQVVNMLKEDKYFVLLNTDKSVPVLENSKSEKPESQCHERSQAAGSDGDGERKCCVL